MCEKEKYGRLWGILHGMVTRCCCRTSPRYKDYGGRGIGVSPRWYDPETGRHKIGAFAKWAKSHGYREGLQIDRIDNDGPYAPDNCRFVTPAENNRNRRTTRKVTIEGITMCELDWCAVFGVPYELFRFRLDHGWDRFRAMTVPRGMRRPYSCVHKAAKGGGCHGTKHRKGHPKPCPFETESEMRGCPHFKELSPYDNAGFSKFMAERGGVGNG